MRSFDTIGGYSGKDGEYLRGLHTEGLHFDASPGDFPPQTEQKEPTAKEQLALSQHPSALLAQFCQEIGGIQAEQEHMTLFLSLLNEIREGRAGL